MSDVVPGGASGVRIGLSVVICTYNGAERLGRTLEALARCRATFPVDVVLVDNKSTDGSAEVARLAWNKIGNPDFEFRTIFEPQQGLSFARHAGLSASRSNIVVFVDDDNFLAPDYLENAWSIMAERPAIGVLGGEAVPSFAASPPDWFVRHQGAFALGKQGDAEGDITDSRGWVWGAGAVFRKAALLELASTNVRQVLTDRRGTKLSTGGDVELCLYLRELGWKIWYSPRLKFEHFMPPGRFDWKRFCALTFENGVLSGTVVQPLCNGAGRVRASLRAIRLHARWIRATPTWENLVLQSHSLMGELSAVIFRPALITQARSNKARLSQIRESKLARAGVVEV